MMIPSIRSRVWALRRLLLVVCFLLVGTSVSAAQIVVYSLDGSFTDGLSNTTGGCNLREAIVNANTASKSGSIACERGTTGGNVIVIPPLGMLINSSLFDDPSDLVGAAGDLDISSDITIEGGGYFSTVAARSGGRIFDVLPGGRLTLDGVQVTSGQMDEGGAIRVQGPGGSLPGGVLTMRYSSVSLSSTPSTTLGGKGAGIYVAPGGTANIDKSEISFNQSSGVLSEGGGIYCDTGCTLNLTDSSIMANSATDSGGGIYVAPGGTLDMRQTSIGDNTAVNGSGVYSLGSVVNFFGDVIADNGVGAAGDDLDCAGGTFGVMVPEDATLTPIPGMFSLIENPSSSCGAGGSVVTRTSMTPGLPDRVFYDIVNTMFNTAPTRAYRVSEQFNAYTRNVIPVDAQVPVTGQLLCAGHVDQHGRVMATGTPCDVGATQLPVMHEPILGANAFANNGTINQMTMVLDVASPSQVTISLTPLGGIGEPCNPSFHIDFVFPPGSNIATANYDPTQIFTNVGLNEPERICKMNGVATGDAAGAQPGIYWIKVFNSSATTSGLASPNVGTYLYFGAGGVVPVGVGGHASIVLTPPDGTWQINSITITPSTDSAHFAVDPAPAGATAITGGYSFPSGTVLPSGSAGGYPFQVQCRPGTTAADVGDFDGEVVVSTNYGDLAWGLRCTEAHFASLSVSRNTIPENDSSPTTLQITLDSPNLLPDLSFTLTELTGATAVSGSNFRWLDPLPVASVVDPTGITTALVDQLTLTIPTGQTTATAHFKANDDGIYNGDKSFSMVAAPLQGGVSATFPYTYLYWMPGNQAQADFTMTEVTSPQQGINVGIAGMPASAPAGTRTYPVVAAVNSGTSDITNAIVSLTVDPPAKILSFVLPGSTCTVSPDFQTGSCQVNKILRARPANYGTPSYIPDPQHPYQEGDDAVQVQAILLMAEMNQAPQLDYKGHMTARASGTANGEQPSNSATVAYVIQGTGMKIGMPGLGSLLAMGLLLLRRFSPGRSVGRRGGRRY